MRHELVNDIFASSQVAARTVSLSGIVYSFLTTWKCARPGRDGLDGLFRKVSTALGLFHARPVTYSLDSFPGMKENQSTLPLPFPQSGPKVEENSNSVIPGGRSLTTSFSPSSTGFVRAGYIFRDFSPNVRSTRFTRAMSVTTDFRPLPYLCRSRLLLVI